MLKRMFKMRIRHNYQQLLSIRSVGTDFLVSLCNCMKALKLKNSSILFVCLGGGGDSKLLTSFAAALFYPFGICDVIVTGLAVKICPGVGDRMEKLTHFLIHTNEISPTFPSLLQVPN